MKSKRPVCLTLDPPIVERLDALAETMSATRSWTASRLLDSALPPAGSRSPGAGSAGDPSPGISPVAAGREAS